ncbi:hypothetical protein CANCADRAFT_31586 [Tortispora caseinolytica NRRL Y-17796]|uniref:Sugar phosphate transporter domain-containing protein n=1 Tax=Tortispora caseinolytica NRRL Y-17796 TaxID=767744 RepID=A0A1E4TG08_9ASCO|nr:hypothetical protein CANCADRAFT_31586 [Tortispora caseinolytica NRRL Y-17796]
MVSHSRSHSNVASSLADYRRDRQPSFSDDDSDQRPSSKAKTIVSSFLGHEHSAFILRITKITLLILSWYTFSISLSLYNKWMFGDKRFAFHFPLFTTAGHFLIQFILSAIVVSVFPSLKWPPDTKLSTNDILLKLMPCSSATSLDIGLGNMSLQVISLAFYTMIKSSSLMFVLLFAFLFRLEIPTWNLVLVIFTISLGVILMVASEAQFVLSGFLLVLSASMFSGLRWSVTQLLLKTYPRTHNPFSTLLHLAPGMAVTLFIIALFVEDLSKFIKADLWTDYGMFKGILLLSLPGCIAFCMTISEFALIQTASVVSLSVAGIFKEALVIAFSSMIFGDSLHFMNMVGLAVTIAAIAAYNYMRLTKLRNELEPDSHLDIENMSLDDMEQELLPRPRSRSRSHSLAMASDVHLRHS